MPPDGGQAPARRRRAFGGRSRKGARGKVERNTRSARFRRWMIVAHAVTLSAHVVPTLALMALLAPGAAAVTGAAMFALTAARLAHLLRETRRNRWVTRLVDEPVLAHWCASIL